MIFETDNQTLKDLDIPIIGKNSVFELFNKTQSLLGKDRLRYYLNHPLTDLVEINNRKNAISFFKELEYKNDLEINKNDLDFIEHYLSQGNNPTRHPSKIRTLEKALMQKISPTSEYYIIERGIDYTISLLNNIFDFTTKIAGNFCPEIIEKNNSYILDLFNLPEFRNALKIKEMQKLNPLSIATYDYIFRYKHQNDIRSILNIIYDYDVFIAVSQVAAEKDFSFPEMLPAQESTLEMEGLYSPFINNPVKNDINFSSSKNLAFITGPNMAGKSSLLKTIGITTYLAHVGFPVPAFKCRISVLSGMYTTINLSDSLDLGYSHFYAEVDRIKFIAKKLKDNSNMLIIFDELFRGTNIKDAYDGSVAIISAFSKIKNCFFAISTHIIEVAEYMNNSENKGIQFKQLTVTENDNSFQYTYKVEDGISDKRLGMYIIEKEKVIDIINSIK